MYVIFLILATSLFPLPIGTGKTLLARAVSKQLDANFLKVVSSAIVDKYIGESARLIREMFGEDSSQTGRSARSVSPKCPHVTRETRVET